MGAKAEIDEIDVIILKELIKDARTKCTEIARKCGLSVPAITMRIERLKATGVITGAALYINMSVVGYLQPASIMIEATPDQESTVIKIAKQLSNLVMIDRSVGMSNLVLFLVAEDIKIIDAIKQSIKKQAKVGKIEVSFWHTPEFIFENIDLQQTGS